jgi:hypothetical protein
VNLHFSLVRIKQWKVYSHSTPPTQSPLKYLRGRYFPPKYHCTKKNFIVSSGKVSSHSKNNLQLSRRRGISGFWPRVRGRALCAPIFLGPLIHQMGRYAPPHRSFADPTKIKNKLFPETKCFPSGPNSDRQGCIFSTGLGCTQLSYIVAYWAMLHPTKLCCIQLS